MTRSSTLAALLALAFLGPLRAEGPVVVLEGKRGHWTSPGVPSGVRKFLGEVSHDPHSDLRCLAFTLTGGWVCLLGSNSFIVISVDESLCKKLGEFQGQNPDFQCVAFAPEGGWTLFFGGNRNWTEGKVPDAAYKKFTTLAGQGKTLRSVAYGPHGAWVVLYDKSGNAHGNVPKDLGDRLNQLAKDHMHVRCVSFIDHDWICLLDNGWWSSNLDLAAAKHVGKEVEHHSSVRWIASYPQGGEHNFAKWSQLIHQAYDGQLAGGYGFEVRQHGKIVASGAEGWARAPWEKHHPSVKWTLQKPCGLASVSKTITAVALLKLWEETHHRFSLDEPFWPYLRSAYPDASDGVKHITFRHLLTHHSGFDGNINGIKDLKKLLAAPLAHPPGEVGAYQNVNFLICRILIEQIGKVSPTPYVKSHVLEPMGITDMETHAETEAPTCGYLKLRDQTPGYPWDEDQDHATGYGGWFGSVQDLGKFLNGLRDHKVLNAKTTHEFFKGGLGWDASDLYWEKNGGSTEGTKGRRGTTHSVIAHFPDDVDAVILANCEPPVSVEELAVKGWRESLE